MGRPYNKKLQRRLSKEMKWEKIRDEYLALASTAEEWPETELHNGQWFAIPLCFMGQRHEENIARCPTAWEEANNMGEPFIAGFSILKAGAVIHPHTGYTSDVWRTHLGLICPEGAWIKVDGVEYRWKEGERFQFDDTLLHEARNESNTDRVILIVDYFK